MEDEDEFVIDTARGVIHRASRATPACALDAIPPSARQTRSSMLDATMVMKTRHYRACERCWPS